MDSRLIFESHKTFKQKIYWNRASSNSDSEWMTFNVNQKESLENLYNTINELFNTDIIHIAIGRNDSFTTEKKYLNDKIKTILGLNDFSIWGESFEQIIEVSKIGVYRVGYRSSSCSS